MSDICTSTINLQSNTNIYIYIFVRWQTVYINTTVWFDITTLPLCTHIILGVTPNSRLLYLRSLLHNQTVWVSWKRGYETKDLSAGWGWWQSKDNGLVSPIYHDILSTVYTVYRNKCYPIYNDVNTNVKRMHVLLVNGLSVHDKCIMLTHLNYPS